MPEGTIEQGDANVSDGSVAGSASDQVIIPASAGRRSASIFNDSSSAMYVRLGAAATASAFKVKLLAGEYWELPVPVYLGDVHGIWDTATGNARWSQETA